MPEEYNVIYDLFTIDLKKLTSFQSFSTVTTNT